MAEHSLPQTTKVWQFDQYLLAIAWTFQLLRQQPGVTAAQVAVLEDLVNTALKPCKMHAFVVLSVSLRHQFREYIYFGIGTDARL